MLYFMYYLTHTEFSRHVQVLMISSTNIVLFILPRVEGFSLLPEFSLEIDINTVRDHNLYIVMMTIAAYEQNLVFFGNYISHSYTHNGWAKHHIIYAYAYYIFRNNK